MRYYIKFKARNEFEEIFSQVAKSKETRFYWSIFSFSNAKRCNSIDPINNVFNEFVVTICKSTDGYLKIIKYHQIKNAFTLIREKCVKCVILLLSKKPTKLKHLKIKIVAI